MVAEFVKRFRVPFIVAGSVLVIAIVLYAALISPQGSKLSTLHAKEATLQQQQAHLQTEIATLRQDRADIGSNCTLLDKALAEIPGKPSVDSFLQQVTALAVSSGDPNTPSIAVTNAPAGASTAGVTAITVTLNLAGTYGQMSAFLKGLDTFPRLFTISSINVAGGPIASGGAAINPATAGYTLTLTGSIFYSAAASAPTVCTTTTTTA